MELHVQITIDDDAVNKIANIVTETVKRVAEIQQPGEVNQTTSGVCPTVPPVNAPVAVPATSHSAQIARATQLPVQAMTGQPVSQPTAVPVQPVVPQPGVTQQPVAVPTATRSYTLEDLAHAVMPLTDQGDQVMAQLHALMTSYGVELLQDLPPEHYGSFATALRGMGVQI